MNPRNDFRTKVLRAHFDISKGGITIPVSRSELAQMLGIEEHNHDLVEAIAYLTSERYLRSFAIATTCLTPEGQREVEGNFPHFTPASKPIDWAKWGSIGTIAGIPVLIILTLVGWIYFSQPHPLYSSTQTAGFMPPNNLINLDNVATLIVTFPNQDQINKESTASFLMYAVVLDMAAPSILNNQENYSLNQEYEFDTDKHQSNVIKAGDKSFLVTLLSITQATATSSVDYTFGIQEQ